MAAMKIAIIWRESVYKSLCCPKCGTRLMTPDHKPVNVKHKGLFRDRLHCENCGLFVAYLRPYSGGGQPGEMMGRWHGVKGGDDDDGKR